MAQAPARGDDLEAIEEDAATPQAADDVDESRSAAHAREKVDLQGPPGLTVEVADYGVGSGNSDDGRDQTAAMKKKQVRMTEFLKAKGDSRDD